MKCENCGQEFEGLYVKYDGKYFCRKDGDKCIKEYLYDNTQGCEYGTIFQGEEIRLSPPITEGYLGTIKAKEGGENGSSNGNNFSNGSYVHRNDINRDSDTYDSAGAVEERREIKGNGRTAQRTQTNQGNETGNQKHRVRKEQGAEGI